MAARGDHFIDYPFPCLALVTDYSGYTCMDRLTFVEMHDSAFVLLFSNQNSTLLFGRSILYIY